MSDSVKDMVESLKKKNEELIDKLLDENKQRRKNQKIKKNITEQK